MHNKCSSICLIDNLPFIEQSENIRESVGATVIIVCLTSYVAAMANTCKQLLPIPNYAEKIVEAIGMQDHAALVVSLIVLSSHHKMSLLTLIRGLFAGKTVQRR